MSKSHFKHMQVSFRQTNNRSCAGVIIPDQCHGTEIVEVTTGQEDFSECDGLITKNQELAIGVITADCAPICLADDQKVAVVHAGWRGLCGGMIEQALVLFDSESVEVFVGPHIHSFEIKPDHCYEAITKKFGKEYFSEERGRLHFAFRDTLQSLLPPQAVFDEMSTFTDASLPSHRRDGTLTRLVTIVKRV